MSYTAHDYKVIKSGNILEEYSYQIPFFQSMKKKVYTKKNRFNRVDNINRTQTNLRRIVQCNNDLSKFITLTFKDDIKELKQSNYIFNKFILRLRYKYGKVKYIAVPEFTKKGRVHFHMLATLPYVKNRTLRRLWGQGFINIKEIDKNIEHLAIYLSKYLSKQDKNRFYRKKKFFTSTNLNKPIILRDYEAHAEIDYHQEKELEFTKIYYNEFRGRIIYNIFKINKEEKCHYLQKEKSETKKAMISKLKEKTQLRMPL